jgi:plasmid stability protein
MTRMLQVRNVPDDVHEQLQRRAAEAGMTLSTYVLRQLEDVVARPTRADVFARAARSGMSAPLTRAAEIIRAERDRRS